MRLGVTVFINFRILKDTMYENWVCKL